MTDYAAYRRSAVVRLAVLLVAIWQVGSGLLPHTGSASGGTAARPHFHAVGDRLELGHDEAACPACSLTAVSTPATTSVKLVVHVVVFFRSHNARNDRPNQDDRFATKRSRAPPALA
jgi:hypothetical protein